MATPPPSVTVSPVDASGPPTTTPGASCSRSGWRSGSCWACWPSSTSVAARSAVAEDRAAAGTATGRAARGNWPPDLGHVGARLQQASEWLAAHAALVALVAVAGLLVFGVVAAVVLWLNARGVFMYADAVATGRAEVSRPWRQHAAAASSYFGWSLGITFAMVFTLLFAGGLVVATVFAFFAGRLQGTGGWPILAAMVPVLVLLGLALPLLALAGLALRDFVAPLQIATGLPAAPRLACSSRWSSPSPARSSSTCCSKALVVVASGLVVVVGGRLTCCLGFLPVVMQTVFQPLFHFERARVAHAAPADGVRRLRAPRALRAGRAPTRRAPRARAGTARPG